MSSRLQSPMLTMKDSRELLERLAAPGAETVQYAEVTGGLLGTAIWVCDSCAARVVRGSLLLRAATGLDEQFPGGTMRRILILAICRSSID